MSVDTLAGLDRRRSLSICGAILVTLFVGTSLVGCESGGVLGDRLPALEDEAPLSRAVADALSRDPEVGRFTIRVKTVDADTVRLSGNVDNDGQKSQAERVALGVDGVSTVINTLFLR